MRLRKYKARGYDILGPTPPRRFRDFFPPWHWGSDGGRQRMNEARIAGKIRLKLTGPHLPHPCTFLLVSETDPKGKHSLSTIVTVEEIAVVLTSFLAGLKALRRVYTVNKNMARAFKQTKVWRSILEKNFTMKIRSHFLDPGEFSTMLAASKSIIAGSFLTSCLMGHTQIRKRDCSPINDLSQSHDIDLYVPMLKTKPVFKYLREHGYNCMNFKDLIDIPNSNHFKCLTVQTYSDRPIHALRDPKHVQVGIGRHFDRVPTKRLFRATSTFPAVSQQNKEYASMTDGEFSNFFKRDGVSQCMSFHHKTRRSVIDVFVMSFAVPPIKAVADFDYDFLMNYYDGNKFHVWFPKSVFLKQGFYNPVMS